MARFISEELFTASSTIDRGSTILRTPSVFLNRINYYPSPLVMNTKDSSRHRSSFKCVQTPMGESRDPRAPSALHRTARRNASGGLSCHRSSVCNHGCSLAPNLVPETAGVPRARTRLPWWPRTLPWTVDSRKIYRAQERNIDHRSSITIIDHHHRSSITDHRSSIIIIITTNLCSTLGTERQEANLPHNGRNALESITFPLLSFIPPRRSGILTLSTPRIG